MTSARCLFKKKKKNIFSRSETQSPHVDFGGLGEGSDRVDVVVEDDDSDHHPHAEQHGVCVGEPAAILPVRGGGGRSAGQGAANQPQIKVTDEPLF